MPFNVGTIADMMEVYAGQAGVNRDSINRELLWQIINMKMKDYFNRTGISTTKTTTTTADVNGDGSINMEYELPANNLKVLYVDYNGLRIKKRNHSDVRILKGNF